MPRLASFHRLVRRTRPFQRVACVAAMLLAGCATTPPATEPERPGASGDGTVIGRNDRFVIYDPGAYDTLASLSLKFFGRGDREWVIGDFNDIDHVASGHPVVIPMATINPIGVRANAYQTVPILCYHRFGPGKSKMIVSAAQFAAELEWLEKNDYRVIPMKQLIGFLSGKEAVPRKAVVITIDDGHESAYQYAVPLLRKHGFPATFFIFTDYIGSGGALTWPQIIEMASSDQFEIGGHSKTHRNLLIHNRGESAAAYRNNLEAEVKVPIEVLGKRLQIPITTYAFPYGDTNETVLALLDKNRVQLAASVTAGGNGFFAQPLLLHRTMIFGDIDLEAFKTKLETSRRFKEP